MHQNRRHALDRRLNFFDWHIFSPCILLLWNYIRSPRLALPYHATPNPTTPGLARSCPARPRIDSPHQAKPRPALPGLATPYTALPGQALPSSKGNKFFASVRLLCLKCPCLALHRRGQPRIALPCHAAPHLAKPCIAAPGLARPRQAKLRNRLSTEAAC
jgi:hypothetical protein